MSSGDLIQGIIKVSVWGIFGISGILVLFDAGMIAVSSATSNSVMKMVLWEIGLPVVNARDGKGTIAKTEKKQAREVTGGEYVQ